MKYKDSSDTNGGTGLIPSDGKMLNKLRFATVCKDLRSLYSMIITGGNYLRMGR